MVHLGELGNPYREPSTVAPLTLEVETNDVHADVGYLDRSGLYSNRKISFIGKPSAWIYPDSEKPAVQASFGKWQFDSWKAEIGKNQFVDFNDLIIPLYRILDIRIEIKDRIAIVDVESR